MNNTEQMRSLNVRLKLDGPRSMDCTMWQLSDPLPLDDGTTGAVAVLDYIGVPLDASDGAIRAAVVLEGAELLQGLEMYEPELEVVERQEAGFGVCSLTLSGAPEQLWRLAYLLRMASKPGAVSAAFLINDVQRWAWIRAALYFSGVITPWIQLGDLDQDFSMTREVPDEISVVVEAELFRSRATFFSMIGERLLGPAGYAGQDLQGFTEVVRLVAHRVQKLDVCFVDITACERASDENLGLKDRGFVRHVYEIFSELAEVRLVPGPGGGEHGRLFES